MKTVSSNCLDLDSTLQCLPLLLRPCNSLLAHDASTPVALSLLVLLRVALLDRRDQLRKLRLVFAADFRQSQDGCCL